MNVALILTTVKCAFSSELAALSCARLLDQTAAKAAAGHMSSFFGEVKPELRIGFANMFDITTPQPIAAAKAFATYSGESYPLAA